MGWSAAPSTQSIWNLLCFLFETLKDVDWSFCLIETGGFSKFSFQICKVRPEFCLDHCDSLRFLSGLLLRSNLDFSPPPSKDLERSFS